MAPDNRPRGREVRKASGTGSVNKKGNGLGTGPVGSGSGRPAGKVTTPIGSSNQGSSGKRTPTRAGGVRMPFILVLILAILGGGGGAMSGMFGGGSGSGYDEQAQQQQQPATQQTQAPSSSGDIMGSILDMMLGGYTTSPSEYGTFSTGGSGNYNSMSTTNTASLNTSVAAGSREKYTSIVGNGADQMTIMVYMCGTDLESKSGMGTADLQEMASANISENVNVIVYTGGCNRWKNNIISSSVNQIYQVKSGGLKCLNENAGRASMTDPATLSSFIKYCAENFPANRNELILWDHGSGSVSGYGYDEKNQNSGSMKLSGIKKALSGAGVKFDFIGFDACLMGTVENGLMLSDYADYMIASEETEPGVGWYYTNWLNAVSRNPSMPTAEIGKNIVDDFIDVCARKCGAQKATLSVTDLAELSNTVPAKLTAFSSSTNELIGNVQGFAKVSDARNRTKEFAVSSRIDQIDLVHFAKLLDSEEGRELADALLGAVKYNRTERTIQNAYGLSIYFPYKKASKVNSMVSTYEAIGMDPEYAKCIRAFAQNESAGQSTTDGMYPSSSIYSLLMGRSHTEEGSLEAGFDASVLRWTNSASGSKVISLTEDQWSQIALLDMNVFYDDGEGFIDLGLDNTVIYDDDGNMLDYYDGSWLSIDENVVPYYHLETEENGNIYSINGYVPVLLNGDRAELLLVFDNDHPEGYISGARYVYPDGETETVAKSTVALTEGDEIDFVCDYYTYDGEYDNSYLFGDTYIYSGNPVIANIQLEDESRATAMYVFTDLYQQKHYISSNEASVDEQQGQEASMFRVMIVQSTY